MIVLLGKDEAKGLASNLCDITTAVTVTVTVTVTLL